MSASKSKTGIFSGASGRHRKVINARLVGPDHIPTKGILGLKKQRKPAAKGLAWINKLHKDAISESRKSGRRVSFQVYVDPNGKTTVTPFEEAALVVEPVVEEATASGSELQAALAAARERGRTYAAEILGADDMVSADVLAEMLGTTRVTVNTKRQGGIILGLDGAKRGFRFPTWQLNADGKPYPELAELHGRLGGPWAVYRFLMQPHGELDGLTGFEALQRGMGEAVLEAAESVGRDFR